MSAFNVFIIGVGGEGAVSMGVILARAANMEGKFVRGMQLHGLAQRGGSIPAVVRFGSKADVISPRIPVGGADLVLAFEPLEAIRSIEYASKDRTNVVASTSEYIPIYAHLMNMPYPKMEQVKKKISKFAKKSIFLDSGKEADRIAGMPIFGNVYLLGAAAGAGFIPLKKKSLEDAIKVSLPLIDKNLDVFREGFEAGKKSR